MCADNLLHHAPLTEEDGEILRLYASLLGHLYLQLQAKEALRLSEDKFHKAFAISPDAININRLADGVYIEINAGFTKLTGYTAADVIGRSSLSDDVGTWVNVADRQRLVDGIRTAGEVIGLEAPFRCKDGSIRTCLMSAHAIDFDGEPCILSITRDISDRKQMETALRKSEERFKNFSSVATEGIMIHEHGVILDANQQFASLIGFADSADIIGKVALEIAHLTPASKQRIREQMLAGTTSTFDIDLIGHDGRIIPAETHEHTITYFGRSARLTYLRDISERKLAEDALMNSEYQHRTMVANISDVISIIDAHGRVRYTSPSITRWFGWSPDDLIGSYAWQMVHPDDLERIQTIFSALWQRPSAMESLEFHFKCRDGSYRMIALMATNLLHDPQIHGLLVNYHDITTRKQAELDLLKEKTRAEVLASTAAQLNAELKLDTIMRIVCNETARALRVPVAAVLLNDDTRQHLFFAACNDAAPDELLSCAQPLSRAIYDRLVDRHHDRSFHLLDIGTPSDEIINGELYARMQLQSLISMPLWRDGHLIGALNLYTKELQRSWSPDELSLLESLANLAAQAVSTARSYDDAQRRLHFNQALRDIDRAITGSLDLRVTLQVFISQVIPQLGVDAATILLFDPRRHELKYVEGQGFRTAALRHTTLRLGEGHAGQAALNRQIVTIDNLQQDLKSLRASALIAQEDFVAYVAVPVVAKGQIKGVMELFHRAPLHPVQEWWDYCEALAGQVAIAIDNATLFEELQQTNDELVRAYDTTLEGLSSALDLRDKETEGHSLRVTAMTERLAQAMGVARSEQLIIRRGVLLHDIGKIGIPDNILLKPGPLSEEEWVIMRQHPVYAFQLLSSIPALQHVLDIPYCHHEKWDGSGYPRGMHGVEIPLAARIFAVVDVWDALTSDRVYRKAWTRTATLDYMRAQSGSHFDPEIVEAFIRFIENEDAASVLL